MELETLTKNKCELGSNYLIIPESVPTSEFPAIFNSLASCLRITLWAIGDFLVEAERRAKAEEKLTGKKSTLLRNAYIEASNLCDYEKQTLYNAKNVCKFYPREVRRSVSFRHHQEAMKDLAKQPEVALEFLDTAVEQKLSTREMRSDIRQTLKMVKPEQEEKILTRDGGLHLFSEGMSAAKHFVSSINSKTEDFVLRFVAADIADLNDRAAKAGLL